MDTVHKPSLEFLKDSPKGLIKYFLFNGLTVYIRYMINVVLLGSGNVAYHLALALKSAENVELIQRYSRNYTNSLIFDNSVPHVTRLDLLKTADIYIIAIKDEAISEVSSKLQHLKGLVVHTSGAIPMSVLSPNKNRGVLYPVQSLSVRQQIEFNEVPLVIEADNDHNLEMLYKLASSMSHHVYKLDSAAREKLHVSAVFANNFSNFMFSCADALCQKYEIPFEVLRPLILETGKKVQYMDPLEAQTGPARRNDQEVIDRHLSQLTGKHREIYQLLTAAIKKTYQHK